MLILFSLRHHLHPVKARLRLFCQNNLNRRLLSTCWLRNQRASTMYACQDQPQPSHPNQKCTLSGTRVMRVDTEVHHLAPLMVPHLPHLVDITKCLIRPCNFVNSAIFYYYCQAGLSTIRSEIFSYLLLFHSFCSFMFAISKNKATLISSPCHGLGWQVLPFSSTFMSITIPSYKKSIC